MDADVRACCKCATCSRESTGWCSSSWVHTTSFVTASSRTSSTPTSVTSGRAMETVSPTVFGADEQRDVDVDVARWVRLAKLVLDDERVHERYGTDVEMSLMFVDEQTIAEL